MMQEKKRGLSPVISTILLIMMVIILAAIIFLWARGFVKEIVEKEIGGVKKTAEKFCSDVSFEVSISENEVSILNRGNIPVYKINIKKKNKGTSDIQEEIVNLNIAGSRVFTIEGIDSYEELTIIPVLRGKAGNQIKEYSCKEDYGIKCSKENEVFEC